MELWKYKKLGEVFEINTKSINPQIIDEELVHYSLPAFDSTKLPIIQSSKDILSNKTVIDRETLLVSKLNPRISRIWLVKEIDEHLKSVSSTEFINYISKENVNLDFYYQYFKSEIFQEELLALESGTTGSRKRVTPKDTFKLKLPMPSIQEQQKIASILSTVDKQMDQTEQLIVKTKELKKGLMQQLLTKGIGHTEYKQSELGEIPIEWEVAKLDSLGKWFSGGTPSKANKDYWSQEKAILWVTSTDMHQDRISDTELYISEKGLKAKKLKLLPKETLIFVTRSGILKRRLPIAVAQTELTINQDQKAFVCNDNIKPMYIFYIIQAFNKQMRENYVKTGTTVESVDFDAFKKQLISLPPLEEQQKIASILSTLDEQIESYEKEKVKYEELKKGLMQQLLTGKIRVNVEK
ncbi:type I restriction enzyme S subunit [Solibacillus kalamii]|uniref:Type I restriction modification DNA specificity domain-containing protein n=1 Tax=Solibacillus kalamii TaxID=1748298 RepID=A0ABX3ZGS0_9BACL|nr:restriction endonuclease subunit S [Solibacillus kalamii]MBM7666102.1 type I restriction enzyme S subunit [Solibacillus kalamii]OUZ38600.1 hypothetical protein CBM15_12690 [Solibacillus kalamii]